MIDEATGTSGYAARAACVPATATTIALCGLLYYLSASLALRVSGATVPLSYPQHGLLVALLLATRYERWWLIVLPVLPAHLAAYWSSGAPSWQLIWQAAHSIVLALGIAATWRLSFGRLNPFLSPRHLLLYLCIAVLAGPALLSVLSPAVALAAGVDRVLAIHLWQAEFLASSLAILTWGCCVYRGLLPGEGRLRQRTPMQYAEALLIAALLFAWYYLTFASDTPRHAPLYLVFIPMLWLSVRFGVGAVAMAVTLLATFAAATWHVPLSMRIQAAPQAAVLDLQMFLIVLALTALIVAVMVEERRRMTRTACRDITAHEQAVLALRQSDERLSPEDANRTLERLARLVMAGQIAASIAHEMNQPLGAIRYNAEAGLLFLDRERHDPEEFQQIFEDICRDNGRASDLVRRLRDLLQDHELRLDPLDLNDIVGEVVKLVRIESRRRHTQLETHCAELPPLLGDSARLQQVLLNLILNGMDAMSGLPESRRRIAIRTRRVGATGVQVEVADRGCGIDPEHLPKIFDSFFTSKRHGMGLGLAIARSIVEAHGGRIWARNNPDGVGATLGFEIDTLGSEVMRPAPGSTDFTHAPH